MAKKKKAKKRIASDLKKSLKEAAMGKAKTRTLGTKVQGMVNVSYVQTGIPENHAVDVCEVLGHLLLSDAYRGYTVVTHKDENDGL